MQRKIFHTVLALFFVVFAPLFSFQTLIIAGIALFVFFLLLRLVGISNQISAVPRITFGELFFAVGVICATVLSHPNLYLFQLAMMMLAVADPLAALVGIRFGRRTYRFFHEKRTLEGSGACFIGALIVCLVFQLPISVAIPTSLALTAIEAVSLRGSDNLFLPIATIVIVQFLL